MRLTKAKKFTYNGNDCLKFGEVEEYADTVRKMRDLGKNWILTRSCAIQVRTVPNGDGETATVKYAKVPTITTENLGHGMHRFMTWDEISGYISRDFKAWCVEFDTDEKCLDEEYIARHEGDMCTYMMGKTLFVESEANTDYIIKQWYGERVRMRFFDSSDTRKMFHPECAA